MPLQVSGAISLSNVRGEFGTTFSSLSNCYGIASSIPVSGTISLSNFYGKSASVPSITAPGNSNIDTSSAAQSGSWELSNYVTDTYGKPLTFNTPSYNASHFTTASNVGSKLFFSFPVNKFAQSTPANINVVNRFGRSNTLNPSFTPIGYPIGIGSMGSVTVSNNTATYLLTSYFTDYSGSGLTYYLSANPNGNASISGTTLSVTGNYRNATYTVSVSASNSYSQSASTSLSVTEPSATLSSSGGAKSAYGVYTLHTFTSNGTFTVNSNITYDAWIIAGGGGGGGYYDGGGGGAGGATVISAASLSSGSYSVTVGTAGSGGQGTAAGNNGGSSSFSTYNVAGGGGGGGWFANNGSSGGCGGGGCVNMGGAGGTGTVGYNGASGVSGGGRGGGGGGMGSAGVNSYPNAAGGNGVTFNWGGSNVTVCGGGGAGTDDANTAGSGGSGVGGMGGKANVSGYNAISYGSGGGGAGGGSAQYGGNGSAGIVVIRYATPSVTYNSTNSPGSSYISEFDILTFTAMSSQIGQIDYNITYSKPNTSYSLISISASIYDTTTATAVSSTSASGTTINNTGGSGSIVSSLKNLAVNLVVGRTYSIHLSWWSPGAYFNSLNTNVSLYYQPVTYTSTNSPGTSYISEFDILTFTPAVSATLYQVDYNMTYSKPSNGYGLIAVTATIRDTTTSTDISGTSASGSTIQYNGGTGSLVASVPVNASVIGGRTYSVHLSWWSPGAYFDYINTTARLYYKA